MFFLRDVFLLSCFFFLNHLIHHCSHAALFYDLGENIVNFQWHWINRRFKKMEERASRKDLEICVYQVLLYWSDFTQDKQFPKTWCDAASLWIEHLLGVGVFCPETTPSVCYHWCFLIVVTLNTISHWRVPASWSSLDTYTDLTFHHNIPVWEVQSPGGH